MPMPIASGGVSDLIRLAEKQISAGNFGRARELLSNARSLEPSNEYIGAIMERIEVLGQSGENPALMDTPTAKSPAEQHPAADDDVRQQVKRLTADARSLFERGAYETAFDTLMKAYLLDPVSADVVQAEELIVPAIEMMRKRGTLKPAAAARPGTGQIIRQHLAGDSQGASGNRPAPTQGSQENGEASRPRAQGSFLARLRKNSLLG